MSDHAVTLTEQIAEIKREIAMRERLYPQWIDKGSLSQQTGEKQVARMRATLETLEEIAASATSLPATLYRLRTVNGIDR